MRGQLSGRSKFSINYCISAGKQALLGCDSLPGPCKDSKVNEVSKIAETPGHDGKLVLRRVQTSLSMCIEIALEPVHERQHIMLIERMRIQSGSS